MGNVSSMAEFWNFLKHRKKRWLAPIPIMPVLLGFLIIFQARPAPFSRGMLPPSESRPGMNLSEPRLPLKWGINEKSGPVDNM